MLHIGSFAGGAACACPNRATPATTVIAVPIKSSFIGNFPLFPPRSDLRVLIALDRQSTRTRPGYKGPRAAIMATLRSIYTDFTEIEVKVTWILRDLPATAPSRTVTPTASANQSQQEKQYHGANESVDDQRDHADAEMDAELRQQPIADESADQADDKIANKAVSAAAHHTPGEPAGNNTDDKDD